MGGGKKRAPQRGFNSPLTSFTKSKPQLSQLQLNKTISKTRVWCEHKYEQPSEQFLTLTPERPAAPVKVQFLFALSWDEYVLCNASGFLCLATWAKLAKGHATQGAFRESPFSKYLIDMLKKTESESSKMTPSHLFYLPVYDLQANNPPICWV